MTAHTDSLTLREARARIRQGVRTRLQSFRGQNIWHTPFFVERLDLAAEAYEYQAARGPDGTTAAIDELIGYAREEFTDFLLLEDQQAQQDFSEQGRSLLCESCSRAYTLSGQTNCPHCEHPNLFQAIAMELDSLIEQVSLGVDDPIARRFLSATEHSRVEGAYLKIVTCFETFYRRLNDLAFIHSGLPVKCPPRRNQFQNITATREWFAENHKLDPWESLEGHEIHRLNIVFQKRHVITHNGGIQDSAFIRNTGLREENIGKPVEISRSEILKAINQLGRIVQIARRDFPL